MNDRRKDYHTKFWSFLSQYPEVEKAYRANEYDWSVLPASQQDICTRADKVASTWAAAMLLQKLKAANPMVYAEEMQKQRIALETERKTLSLIRAKRLERNPLFQLAQRTKYFLCPHCQKGVVLVLEASSEGCPWCEYGFEIDEVKNILESGGELI